LWLRATSTRPSLLHTIADRFGPHLNSACAASFERFRVSSVLATLAMRSRAARITRAVLVTAIESGQGARTVERTGIGAAIDAVIGAVIGGGKGAAIDAAIGVGAWAGLVFIQARNDLELIGGTEFRFRVRTRK
jgi:uncharacterized protein YcfJ